MFAKKPNGRAYTKLKKNLKMKTSYEANLMR